MLSLGWTVILPMECKGHFEVFMKSSWPSTAFLLLFELDESQAQFSQWTTGAFRTVTIERRLGDTGTEYN